MSIIKSLSIAALATTAGIFLLAWTEEFSPAGSPFGWLIMALIIAGHLPLLRKSTEHEFSQSPQKLPTAIVGIVSAIAITLCAMWLCQNDLNKIFNSPVVPRESAQLGLLTQVASRIGTEQLLYSEPYPRIGYDETNAFPIALAIPYALARAWGFDWRFAGFGAVAFLAALLAASALRLSQSEFARRDPIWHLIAQAALIVGGAGWLISFRTTDFLQWGPTAPLWPLIAALGLTLAMRWWLMTAFVAGLLAAMNAGWFLMVPALIAYLYNETRNHQNKQFPLLLVVLFSIPAITFGPFNLQWESMGTGILGSIFNGAANQQEIGAHRFPSIHAFGDFLGLRWPIYLCALAGLAYCARIIATTSDASERLRMFALSGLILVSCGPMVWFFHWYSHGILLAALIPAAANCSRSIESEEPAAHPTIKYLPLLAGAFVLVVISIQAIVYISSPIPDTINNAPEGRQSHLLNLAAGWNVESEDHVWGREKYMAVGFTMNDTGPGVLELHLGTIGGDFTPFNPVVFRVNGRVAGVWRELPGEYGYARIPLLEPGDVHIGYNVVELEAQWSRTPKSLNVADDERRLSVSYLGMRWIPLDQLPVDALPRSSRNRSHARQIYPEL